jgi:MoxR-like ATPase
MLAELVTESASLRHFFYQMHRDTRVNELIGETVIKRTVDPGERTETISQGIAPGGILQAQLAVLDDLSRAPGESLNVLLRVLNERKWGSEPIPLLSAIATGNPVSEDGYYGDPLDAATLDRFALQIKAQGLVETSSWDDAGRVIDFYSAPQALDDERYVTKVRPNLINDAASLVPLVVFGDDAKRVLLRLLQVLRDDHNCDDVNSLLTDRTFLVKAVKIMKANALATRGDQEVLPEDLRVLRFLTTFRIPEQVHNQIDQIIDAILAEPPPPPPPPPGNNPGEDDDGQGGHDAGGEGDDDDFSGIDSDDTDPAPQGSSGEDGDGEDQDSDSDDRSNSIDGGNDNDGSENKPRGGDEQTNQTGNSESGDGKSDAGQGQGQGAQQDGQSSSEPDPNSNDQSQFHSDSADKGDEIELKAADDPRNDDSPELIAMRNKVKNLEPLLDCLKGALERGKTNIEENPGGLPRGWARPRSMSQGFEDMDQVELALWTANPTPYLPRVAKRTRPGAGGRVCVIRDTSMSMQGMWNNWAGLLATAVMDLASERQMRVGYLEFNSRVNKYVDECAGQFFTAEYRLLRDRISSARCDGLTNYELPLSTALSEFNGKLPRHRRLRRGQIEKLVAAQQAVLARSPPSVNLAYGSTISGVKLIESMAKKRRQEEQASQNAARKLLKDQHILFITDGQPTSGDRNVTREIAQAQALGVAIHTVFIGYSSCPPVLDTLSLRTGGSRFAAYFDVDTKAIQVIDRDAVSLQEMYADSGKDHELRMLDRMTRMPTVFQRFLDENNLVV